MIFFLTAVLTVNASAGVKPKAKEEPKGTVTINHNGPPGPWLLTEEPKDVIVFEFNFNGPPGPTKFYQDFDGDGFGSGEGSYDDRCSLFYDDSPSCPYVQNAGDCDDTNPTIHYGAEEIPDDGVDQDCDGVDKTTKGQFVSPWPRCWETLNLEPGTVSQCCAVTDGPTRCKEITVTDYLGHLQVDISRVRWCLDNDEDGLGDPNDCEAYKPLCLWVEQDGFYGPDGPPLIEWCSHVHNAADCNDSDPLIGKECHAALNAEIYTISDTKAGTVEISTQE